jgi:CsoR family transcriptional regulator, copper-sensing transcriptional repressor
MTSAAIAETVVKRNKTKILNRLRRLEGQVRGLHKMVEEERPCRDILTLMAGVRSALEATGDQILETYLEECQADFSRGQGDVQRLVEAVRLLRR